jgi:hypothetical protein
VVIGRTRACHLWHTFESTLHGENSLQTGVTVYGTQVQHDALSEIIEAFPEMWTDRGTIVDILEEDMMPIPLLPGWVTNLPRLRVYPSG